MRNLLLVAGTFFILVFPVVNSPAQEPHFDQLDPSPAFSMPSTENQVGIIPFSDPADGTLLAPINPNAYGPGLNSDATGRPFIWQPQGSTNSNPDPTLEVSPNAYGPGVGMDQYGRPVRPRTWP